LLLISMRGLVERAPRTLFFTGKGGVGKTTVACATALALADAGRRVLLVSTDPASNLDEVLGTALATDPTAVSGTDRLYALNVDPEAAARAYRERLVGPYRGVLPDAAVRSIEEQLSGACTVEIAKLLGSAAATEGFDHVVFDTAPTGHTLRLLELPAAWSDFLASNPGGGSCLGPLSGLSAQRALYASTHAALTDDRRTCLVLVARPEPTALAEAARTSRELRHLGVERQELVLNGMLPAADPLDPTAVAMCARDRAAIAGMPAALGSLPRTNLPLVAYEVLGFPRLRAFARGDTAADVSRAIEPDRPDVPDVPDISDISDISRLLDDLGKHERGLIMTMGKGGVGKSTLALALASALAGRGRKVHLTTTDPAGAGALGVRSVPPNLRVTHIDPTEETRTYVDEVMRTAGAPLDEGGRALLEEDLRSPCTEEVAVFRAFARVVHEAREGLVVVDTAPTGHTLLLLDAAEAYHREVSRAAGHAPEEVRELLPRLRDPEFTRVLLVTLAESTPVHEAAALQADLARAGIRPFAWVINQSLRGLTLSDSLLRRRREQQARYVREVLALAARTFMVPWTANFAAVPIASYPAASRAEREVST
jgi:arsenite/tail-anchored protein-transporting ATPase